MSKRSIILQRITHQSSKLNKRREENICNPQKSAKLLREKSRAGCFDYFLFMKLTYCVVSEDTSLVNKYIFFFTNNNWTYIQFHIAMIDVHFLDNKISGYLQPHSRHIRLATMHVAIQPNQTNHDRRLTLNLSKTLTKPTSTELKKPSYSSASTIVSQQCTVAVQPNQTDDNGQSSSMLITIQRHRWPNIGPEKGLTLEPTKKCNICNEEIKVQVSKNTLLQVYKIFTENYKLIILTALVLFAPTNNNLKDNFFKMNYLTSNIKSGVLVAMFNWGSRLPLSQEKMQQVDR
ncbi:hypothetical protein WN51_04846 [Melipona quadrifasciata]|uniref:Uncharacterized protein n=1 Tax=Melipona quadrifasciata TaxID=166423 RepID=A0A0M8ZU90_9HYME|nr:hypothetical protein WN51_04846 [Melipona quadrifasciata]